MYRKFYGLFYEKFDACARPFLLLLKGPGDEARVGRTIIYEGAGLAT